MDQNANPFSRYTNLFRDFNERRVPAPAQEQALNHLVEIAREYNRNTRYYNDNVRDYNEIMRTIIRGLTNAETPTTRRTSQQPTFDISMNMSFWEFPTTRVNNQRTNLSREQIANNTATYGYTNDMRESEVDASGNVCPISLEQFQVGDVICEIRGCGHKFKRPNLMNWLRRNSRCPVCRYDLNTNTADTTNVENVETPVIEIQNINDDIQESLSGILQSLIANSMDASGNIIYSRD
jgi:hypothetical protein